MKNKDAPFMWINRIRLPWLISREISIIDWKAKSMLAV
jgi:hypothetical protein